MPPEPTHDPSIPFCQCMTHPSFPQGHPQRIPTSDPKGVKSNPCVHYCTKRAASNRMRFKIKQQKLPEGGLSSYYHMVYRALNMSCNHMVIERRCFDMFVPSFLILSGYPPNGLHPGNPQRILRRPLNG